MNDLDVTLDEVTRLRAAIVAHRDWVCANGDSITVADMALWQHLNAT